MGPVLHPAKDEEIYAWHCFISEFFHVILHYYKKKTSTCGSQVGYTWIANTQNAHGSVGHVVNRYDPNQALHFITCFSGCHPQTKISAWMWSVFLIDHMFLRKWHWCLVAK